MVSTRREWLQRMGGGFGSLGLLGVLSDEMAVAKSPGSSANRPIRPPGGNPLSPLPAHFPARAKRVIFLFMNGGPSHVDTFDPKPQLTKHDGGKAPDALTKKTGRKNGSTLLRSPFRFQKYGESGIEVSELYPEVGACIDDICVIRSMHTDIPNHEPALLMMNSGQIQPTRPCMGSWLTYGLGTENQNLPGYVVICPGKPVVGPQLWSNSFLPGIYQGTHVNNRKVDPRTIISNVNNAYLSREEQRLQLDLLGRMNERHAGRRDHDPLLESRIQSLEMAFRMQFEARDAFDIGRESAATRSLYGEGEFANACLIARRLAERGVRMTQVYYGDGQPWDDHEDILKHRDHARKSDRAIAGLLKDLKARGLLEDTLVIWGGEFGRTPTSERGKGRDHHSIGFSMWMAGGGVKGGHVHGATDELGFAAIEDKVHIHDLHATILHLMGIDHERLTYRYSGRDFRLTDVSGVVVKEIFA
ncbi:MAG: DUF1501 domain-containing protein [Isosphaeraceae bacterium]